MRYKNSSIGSMTHALIVGSIVLAGCADNPPAIQPASSSQSKLDTSPFHTDTVTLSSTPAGMEEYRVFQEAPIGPASLQSVRSEAEKRATEFCDRSGKVMKPLRETTTKPPFVLYNNARIEIIFGCVEKISS
jgi:hypothetical protein